VTHRRACVVEKVGGSLIHLRNYFLVLGASVETKSLLFLGDQALAQKRSGIGGVDLRGSVLWKHV